MRPVVVIETTEEKQFRYTRYAGGVVTHQFLHAAALSQYWVEEIRIDPDQFSPPQEPDAA